MPNSKSGRGSFRHFYFSYFTFHFYVYKGLRGIGAVVGRIGAKEGILLLLYYREGVSIAPK